MPPSNNQIEKRMWSAAQAEPVRALGDSAFLRNGPYAHEVWVRAGIRAVMVAIGDPENDTGMLAVAPYLMQALP